MPSWMAQLRPRIGPVEPLPPERRRPVERLVETAAGAELPVDGLHQVPAEQVVTAVPLVEERRVIEERLHEEQILPEETAEVFHGVEHAPEEPEPGPNLARGEPGRRRPPLLGEIPRQRPEERLLAVVVPVDPESLGGRIRDLHEGELRNAERTDLDVDEDDRVAIVARGPELDAGPALLRRREDPEEPMTRAVQPRRLADPEARAHLGGHEPSVQALANRRRQPVQLVEGAELETGDPRVRQPAVPSSCGAGSDAARAAPVDCRSQRARARARSSGVLRFMNARSGSAKGRRSARAHANDSEIVEQVDDLELPRPETSLHRRETCLSVDGVESLRSTGRLGNDRVGLAGARRQIRGGAGPTGKACRSRRRGPRHRAPPGGRSRGPRASRHPERRRPPSEGRETRRARGCS